jgi:hypothetical protein
METFGLAAARKWKSFSFGAAVRYQRFEEIAETFRRDLDAPGIPIFTVNQMNAARTFGSRADRDLTFVGGIRWTPLAALSLGAVWKKGPTFPVAVQAAGVDAPMSLIGTTAFHVPSTAGIGLAFRPVPQLTLTADVVRLRYGKLTDHFVSVMEYGTGDLEPVAGYTTNDGTELHAGVEYFVVTRVPVGIRAGWWRDPAHSIAYRGPTLTSHDAAAHILFPGSQAEDHYSVGLGIALPRLGFDVAYDTSRSLRTASVSIIVRR